MSKELEHSRYMNWVDVNFIIKWTLENAKHLDHDESYYIEKITDDCFVKLRESQEDDFKDESKTALKLLEKIAGWENAELVEGMLIEGGHNPEYGTERPAMWHDVIVKMPGSEGE